MSLQDQRITAETPDSPAPRGTMDDQVLVAQTPAQHQSPWLTAAEAAGYVKVERRTLLLWVRQGKVRAFQLSGTMRHVWRFRQSDLDAMLAPSSAGSADRRQQ